jgi:hypothetical protein
VHELLVTLEGDMKSLFAPHAESQRDLRLRATESESHVH